MTATVAPHDPAVHADLRARLRAGLLAIWAGVTGAAPHVLHHVVPLAGTALVAGAGGQIVFAADPDTADTPVGHADSTVEHTDPVCGMTVEPATAAATATHGGRTYAFCSTGCHQAFTTNPDQYLLAGTN